MRRQSGFSMVELMISITLGIVLTFGVIQVYTGSKETYRTQEALARMQDNARFALDIIARDLRMSAYIGCSSMANGVVVSDNSNVFNFGYDYSAAEYMFGNNAASDGSVIGSDFAPGISASSDRNDHTDILLVQGAGRCIQTAGSASAASGTNIPIDANACGFAVDDIGIIADCENADVFEVDAINASGITTSNGLTSTYATDSTAEIMTVYSNTYFVADDSGVPTLFTRDNIAGTRVALVEGVENFQVQFGVDNFLADGTTSGNDGIPDRFVGGDAVAGDYTNVVAVRYSLLMRTLENFGTSTYTDSFDESVDFDGGPIRRQFVKTVKLRNRGI